MGHGITKTDKVLSVREFMWHHLEDVLQDNPSLEETRKHVHDYEVVREPVYRRYMAMSDEGPVEGFQLVPDQQFNVRTDNDEALAVVPTLRTDISVDEMYKLAELVVASDKGVKVETAGSFDGGRNLWILLGLDEPIIIKGDPRGESLSYLALQNGYVQGIAFRLQATFVRIQCKNTSRFADLNAERNGMNLTLAHTSGMEERMDEVRMALGMWREDLNQWKLAKEFMVEQRVTPAQANWFIESFIPEPKKLKSERVLQNIERDRLDLLGELYSGLNEGIEMTSLGLFEAASSWNEHVRTAQSPVTRFKRATLSPTDVLGIARDLALDAPLVDA